VIPPGNQSPPANIVISSFSVVQQNISVETMRVSWDQAQNAIAYEAQWRRNDGNWVNVPRSSTTSFDVRGFMPGAIWCACASMPLSSGWGYSEEKTLTGKVGNPPKPVGFTASENVVFGIELNWGFPANTGDTLKTEIQYSLTGTADDAILLPMYLTRSANISRWALRQGRFSGTARSWWTEPATNQGIPNLCVARPALMYRISQMQFWRTLKPLKSSRT
jgi:predicted phage tail protein